MKFDDLMSGICSEILFHFQEQIAKTMPEKDYIKELAQLTKFQRQLIRATLCNNSLTLEQDQQMRTSMATLWNMMIMMFDQIMGQQEDKISTNQ
jgi:hypothetical protein